MTTVLRKPWNVAAPELDFFEEAQRAFDLAFGRSLRPPTHRFSSPNLALFAEEQGYRLEVDLPGVKSEDVELLVEDSILTLTASRSVTLPEGATARRRERRDFRLERRLRLPDDADLDSLHADLADGVLTVALGRRPAAGPLRVVVGAPAGEALVSVVDEERAAVDVPAAEQLDAPAEAPEPIEANETTTEEV